MATEMECTIGEENQKKHISGPIELVETRNVIWRKGYYICRIIDAYDWVSNGERKQKVYFTVDIGKYRGFKLSTVFNGNWKSRKRFSHLCKAVGFTQKEIESVNLLVGKSLILLVVPVRENYKDRKSTRYIIRLFHPLNKDDAISRTASE